MLYGFALFATEDVFPDLGYIFRVRKDGTGYQIIFNSFKTFTNGYVIPASLFEASNGKLIGFADHGDLIDPNVGGSLLYQMNKDGSSVEVLRRLPANPSVGQAVFGAHFSFETPDGWLYGSNPANVFRCRLDGSQFSILHTFGSVANDGTDPGPPILGSDGRVYGACPYGGGVTNAGTIYYGGTIYRMERDGTGYQIVRRFNILIDRIAFPSWLMEDDTGALVAYSGRVGPAWLFKLNKDGAGLVKLLELTVATHGAEVASGALMMAADGFLYGRTRVGGVSRNGCGFSGTVFRVRPNGTDFRVIYRVGANSPQDCGAAEVSDEAYEPLIVSRDSSIYAKGGNPPEYSIFRLSPPRPSTRGHPRRVKSASHRHRHDEHPMAPRIPRHHNRHQRLATAHEPRPRPQPSGRAAPARRHEPILPRRVVAVSLATVAGNNPCQAGSRWLQPCRPA